MGADLLLNSTLNVRHISRQFKHHGFDLNCTSSKYRQNMTQHI